MRSILGALELVWFRLKTKVYSPWDEAHKLVLKRDWLGRGLVDLDRGVNFFVLMLENLGVRTWHSCEGHPLGFYIAITCPLKTARQLADLGPFDVILSRFSTTTQDENKFTLRMTSYLGLAVNELAMERNRRKILRDASRLWTKEFGHL